MTIKDATDFWQAIEITAYAMEGESREYGIERMKFLGECLDQWLADHPEIDRRSPDGFAMHAVARLVSVFAFNERFGPGTEMREAFERAALERIAEQSDDIEAAEREVTAKEPKQ